MPYRKTIVCLANSRKHQGRCIAGKELVEDRLESWIRPISDRPLAELRRSERCYWLGREPRLLDVLSVTLDRPGPGAHAFQAENHLIAANPRVRKRGRWKWKSLTPFLDRPSSLWRNGNSSYHGHNDRMSLSAASSFRESLFLIEPRQLVLETVDEGKGFRSMRRRLRASFVYRGVTYRFSVTDPATERALRLQPEGEYPVSAAYLCVSLGEPHTDNFCYKLVAAVIPKKRI